MKAASGLCLVTCVCLWLAATVQASACDPAHYFAQGTGVAPASAEVVRLRADVDRGSECAVDAAFTILNRLDGGDLEDVMRSLGSLASEHPRLLLRMFQKHDVPDRQIERISRMLPLDSADDDCLKRRIVENRFRGLSSVRDASLRRVKTVAVTTVEKYARELCTEKAR